MCVSSVSISETGEGPVGITLPRVHSLVALFDFRVISRRTVLNMS